MRGRRQILLLVVSAVFGVVGSGIAGAADGPPAGQLTVLPADGGAPRQPLSLPALTGREDVHDARYTVRAADGTTSEVTVAAGFSLALLLREAGVDLDAFTYVEVPRPDGTSVLVLREQIVADGDGVVPPVVWVDAQGTHFLRPSAGDDDVNADDVVTPIDGAIAVRLKTDEPFAVRIDASAVRVRVGKPVAFKVVLLAGQRTADMTFDWYFADGSANGEGGRVTHRFAHSGAYLVQVNVVKSGRTLDAYDIQVVRVRAAVRHDMNGGGAGGGGSGEGDGSSGGAGGGNAGGGGSGTSGGSGEGGGIGSGGYGSGTTGGAGAGATATGGGSSMASPSYPSRPPRSTPPPASSVFAAQRGELVSGTLLASADAVPLPAGASGPSGRARGATEDQPLRIPVGVWIAAGLAVLLTVGWTLESRHIPPFWQP